MMAQNEIAHYEMKNGHGTSCPLRKEKWPWYITPIARKKIAAVNQAHCEMKNGRGKPRALQNEVNLNEKCDSKVQPMW